MKTHPRANTPPRPGPGGPAISAPPDRVWHGAGLSLLAIQLVLAPLLFWRGALEVCEVNKAALLYLSALALAVLGLPVLVRAVRAGGLLAALRGAPLTLAGVLFLVSAALSTLSSVAPWLSLLGAYSSHTGLLTLCALLVLFLATRDLVRTPDAARRLLACAAVPTAFLSVHALCQAVGLDAFEWLSPSYFSGWSRPFSTMGHPNFLAAYLVTALPLLGHLAAHSWRTGSRLSAGLLAGLCFLAALGMVATLSRGAWGAALAFGVVLLAQRGPTLLRHRRLLLPVGGLVLAGALFVLLATPSGRLLQQRLRGGLGDDERLQMWGSAWKLFLDRPLLGHGPDTFLVTYGAHRTLASWQREWNQNPTRPHNLVLDVLVTQGVAGGLVAALAVWGLVRACRRAWRQGLDGQPLVGALIGAVVAYVVQGLFNFTVLGNIGLFVVLLGIVAGLGEAASPASVSLPAVRLRGTVVVTGGLAALLFLANLSPGDRTTWWKVALTSSLVVGALVVGVVAAWPHLQAGSPSQDRRAALPPSGLRLRLAAGAVALVAGWVGVVEPWWASIECRRGDRLLGERPLQALEHFSRAVTLAPHRDVYRTQFASGAHAAAAAIPDRERRRELVRRSVAAMREAIRLAPTSAEHHANLGRMLTLAAQGGQAPVESVLEAFERAIALDPFNTFIQADAGRAAVVLGRLDEGRRILLQALEFDPDLCVLHAGLASLALKEGRRDEAERCLARAVASNNWHDEEETYRHACAQLAALYLETGRFREARQAAEQVLVRWGDDVPALLARARALEGMGEGPRAAEAYREVLAAAPAHAFARASLHRLGGAAPAP